MTEEEFGFEAVGITCAGIEAVECGFNINEELSFFQQLVRDRPELDQRLSYWHWFVNKHRKENDKEKKTIRENTYDIIEDVINKFTELVSIETESSQSLQGTTNLEET